MKPETDEEKRNLKKSLQKVLEKFGGLKKMLYLCTTFRFEIEKWFFKWFFDLLVITREKIVVFICQFLFIGK